MTHYNARTNEGRKGARYRGTVNVNDFLRLQRSGKTANQIAESLGCTPRTVVRLRSRHGLAQPYHRPTPIDEQWKARAKALLDDGASISEVCRTLNTTFDTVKKHFPDAGWTPTEAAQYARAVRTANDALRAAGHAPLPALHHV